MVAQAQAKRIYDCLLTADLADALAEEAAAAAKYDIVIAADVFVYVNNLAPVVAGVARVVMRNALFAFTVETRPADGVKLLPTLRYAHGETYVRRILADAGFQVASLSRAFVRREKGVPVDSLVVVAQPSTARPSVASSGG
jgi:predicted TPR repeat methyltransferase